MAIEKEDFRAYTLEEERPEKDSEVFSVRLNKKEMEEFAAAGIVLQQGKPSTIIKQLALIGLQDVLHDPKVRLVLGIGFKNKEKNDRLGITTVAPDFMQK